MIEEYLTQEELVENLWKEYTKLPEYLCESPHPIAIKKDHTLIIKREEKGLGEILTSLQKDLSDRKNLYLEVLKKRKASDWIGEWMGMHKTLFKYVLIKQGVYRDTNVRFGNPGNEELHNIPHYHNVPTEMGFLADEICFLINQDNSDISRQITLMAKAHYKFIRIHPFIDGNGRIGRIIIDQLCLAHSLPMAMGGYPRSNHTQRRLYHEAIQSCLVDPNCVNLAAWIREKVYNRLKLLA